MIGALVAAGALAGPDVPGDPRVEPAVPVTYGGYRPWTGDVIMDRIELGDRVTTAYDEPHSIAYRIGEALGVRRCDVPLSWQWTFGAVGRSSVRHWSHSER